MAQLNNPLFQYPHVYLIIENGIFHTKYQYQYQNYHYQYQYQGDQNIHGRLRWHGSPPSGCGCILRSAQLSIDRQCSFDSGRIHTSDNLTITRLTKVHRHQASLSTDVRSVWAFSEEQKEDEAEGDLPQPESEGERSKCDTFEGGDRDIEEGLEAPLRG